MSSDPLQCIPLNQWHNLKSLFKSDWPRSISGFTVLETQEYIIKLGLDYGFKVYSPYGDVNKGMVAVNTKSTYYEIIIQHAKDDTTDLEYALLNSEVIDWSNNFEVPFAPQHITDCVQRVVKQKKIQLEYLHTTETFVLNTKTPFEVTLPAGFSFELLSLDYIQQVNSVWPHRYSSSEWYFELLTKAKLAYGLFNNDDLISWVYLKEMGALGHLYTMENQRRKGYGEIVLKLFSNILREQGRTVYAFCVAGNVNAHALYVKLGFDSVQDVHWSGIKGIFNEIIIQHTNNNTDCLEYALLNSKIIDWSKNYAIPFFPPHINSCIYQIILTKLEYSFTTETFLLNKKTPFEVKLPVGFSFELLSPDYVKHIDSVWPHGYSGSEWYFEMLTKAKLAYGLFKNKELVSWVYLIEMGALGHLYTMTIHRRKGYGEMVLKLFSNILMEQGRIVFANCVIGNMEAHALYEKLGFDNAQSVNNYGIRGNSKKQNIKPYK